MNKLEKIIYTAIGQASMCWSETPTGVFDEKLANEIAKKLVEDLGLEKMADAISFGNAIGKNGEVYDKIAKDKIKDAFNFITQTESISEQFISDVNASVANGDYDLNTTQSLPLQKEWPESSQVKETRYRPEDKILEVEFKSFKKDQPRKVYQYFDFPIEQWNNAYNAESIGAFINKEVKPNCQYVAVSDFGVTVVPDSDGGL
jgi:hypothetical protein